MIPQTCARVAGHFGEWLQGRLGSDGPIALVTVPCPALYVEVTLSGDGDMRIVQPDPAPLPPAQAARLLAALGYPARGSLHVTATMAPGRGAGASTAALVALARAFGAHDAVSIARACCAVEGASDPVMHDAPERLLWAPRRAEVLERLPAAPAVEVIGGFLGDGEITDPEDTAFPDISDLIPEWRRAAETGDATLFARCASQSASRTTALRGPSDDPTAALATSLGAMGHIRAHTGSARGLLFPTGGVPNGATDALHNAGVQDVLKFRTGDTS
ncbi:MAG: propanediol utilization protein [Pseudomonadota bacterium]